MQVPHDDKQEEATISCDLFLPNGKGVATQGRVVPLFGWRPERETVVAASRTRA